MKPKPSCSLQDLLGLNPTMDAAKKRFEGQPIMVEAPTMFRHAQDFGEVEEIGERLKPGEETDLPEVGDE